MKLAIMQPYLFPYLGYYQLAAAVDEFVFYDDVNYIKNGWVNRNRLLLSGSINYFTVPLAGASPFQKIHEVRIQDNGLWRKKMLASIRQSYGKAPQFDEVMPLIEMVLLDGSGLIADMARQSITIVAAYLGLRTLFHASSRQYGNADLGGSERVLDICRRTGAETYVNLPGGRSLYDAAVFSAAGIGLVFLDPVLPVYRQTRPPFEPGLSIIDVLMWNEPDRVRDMLAAAALVPA